MNKESAIWTAIAVAFLLLALGFSTQLMAQHQQVRCINILDGKTVQIFNQQNCPHGWAPI